MLVLTDSKAKNNKQKKQEGPPFNEMGFTSEVIVPDECSVSKVPPQTKQTSPVVKPVDDQGKTPKKSSKHCYSYLCGIMNNFVYY